MESLAARVAAVPLPLRHSQSSDQFDNRLPGVEGGDDRVEGRRECRNQGAVSAVAQPHPQKPPCVTRLVGQVEKVLVLADDDSVMGERPRSQGTVVKQVKSALENVFCVMSTVAEPTGQGRRQLVVDQKPHATSTTTWFVCWAA